MPELVFRERNECRRRGQVSHQLNVGSVSLSSSSPGKSSRSDTSGCCLDKLPAVQISAGFSESLDVQPRLSLSLTRRAFSLPAGRLPNLPFQPEITDTSKHDWCWDCGGTHVHDGVGGSHICVRAAVSRLL